MRTTEFNIWEMILRPRFGKMSGATARSILELSIPDSEVVRMKALLAKAKAGTITPDETLELDEYERAGNILSILKARAKRVLNQTKDK